jgi:competence protein CoiA
VLATSPDGARRIAFEAQLAAATVEDLTERTATMGADDVEVCWVTDKDTT